MHFRTFRFMADIWNIKKRNEKKEKPVYESHIQQKERDEGGRKKNHQFETDTLVLSEYANLIYNDTVPPVSIPVPLNPWKEGLSASMMVTVCPHTHTHTICTCLHEQSVHKCNVTVRRLHHIFPANYIMTQTALWKTIPGANVWLFYTQLIKAVWR